MMRAVVFNLGCKVNQYESDVLAQELTVMGYEVFNELSFADIYILNTCAVTAEAERKSRQAVARCRAMNPQARIFVCGCASERRPQSFEKDNVIFVCGASGKSEILSHLSDEKFCSKISANPVEYENNSVLPRLNRTRAYVKIQDGCNSFCSYCIIPYLRGRSRSRSMDDVIREVAELSKNIPEIVLTGINVMSYGADIKTNLTRLIESLKNFDVRIRLSSFYAEGITQELLDSLFSLKKFCPHFHLSLQSGDDKVLSDMNRHYTTAIYEEKINLIRSYDKNACIATDVICGYPTESEENHRRTVEFINRVGFSDLHVFPYSPREGTKAYRLPVLPPQTVKSRRDDLLYLKNRLHREFLTRNIGVSQSVLIEDCDGEYVFGYSCNYIKIYIDKSRASLMGIDSGNVIECMPTEILKDGLKAEVK